MNQTLSPGEKRLSIILFFLIVVNSFVELLGLATVVPVIGAVLDPTGAENELIAKTRMWFESGLGDLSDVAFIESLVGLMVFAFA